MPLFGFHTKGCVLSDKSFRGKKFIGKQVMNLLWEVCIRYTSRTERGLSGIDIVLYYLKKPKITFKFTLHYEVKFYA